MNKKIGNNIGTEYSSKYLLYTRRSTDDADNQKNSIDYQIAEGLRFSENNGLPIATCTIGNFCENGVIKEFHSAFKENLNFEIESDGSVKQWVERPKFLMMADVLLKRKFKGVICLCWDRISRNKSDDVIIDKLMRKGVDILFVQARYEKTSFGEFHMDMDGSFSRHYSRVISEKVRLTANKLRSEGKCIYLSPLGYLDYGSDNKPIDPERAPLIKRIFELYSTGEWSYATLADWANKQGLTTKPARRKRTVDERLSGIPLDSIPKVSRKITPKTIEKILLNPFYIGKILYQGEWLESTVHQPLIDTNLFLRVKAMQKTRTVSMHYPELFFTPYRGLIRCGSCGRVSSPYLKKGNIYYRLKCKAGCKNEQKNFSEKEITKKVKAILERVSFNDEELRIMGIRASTEIDRISERRDNELSDWYRRLNKTLADLDYLAKEKVTLLRTGVMNMDTILSEEFRLKGELEVIQTHIRANAESTEAMLNYVITFSRLVKIATTYFEESMDSEKHNLVVEAFSELQIFNGELKYKAKEGFEALLRRFNAPFEVTGDPDYVFLELPTIYSTIKKSVERGQQLSVLKLSA